MGSIDGYVFTTYVLNVILRKLYIFILRKLYIYYVYSEGKKTSRDDKTAVFPRVHSLAGGGGGGGVIIPIKGQLNHGLLMSISGPNRSNNL